MGEPTHWYFLSSHGMFSVHWNTPCLASSLPKVMQKINQLLWLVLSDMLSFLETLENCRINKQTWRSNVIFFESHFYYCSHYYFFKKKKKLPLWLSKSNLTGRQVRIERHVVWTDISESRSQTCLPLGDELRVNSILLVVAYIIHRLYSTLLPSPKVCYLWILNEFYGRGEHALFINFSSI